MSGARKGEARRGAADLAVICDRDGVVVRVLQNTLPAGDGLEGLPFEEAVDVGSREKARRMLAETRKEGAVFGWELAMAGDDGIVPLHFAAGETDDAVLVVGASSRSEAAAFYEEMMRVSNEQANELRSLLKERTVIPEEGEENSVFEEMTRLNNELAKAQREMARKNAELERLNEQKNQFLGMAAHDLRNPLGVILMYSELLLDHLSDEVPEQEREMLRIVHSSSEFMLGLVNDLLDVSRIEAGKLELNRERVELGTLLRRNAELNRVFADEKGIDLRVEVDEGIPPLFLDRGKVEQVLNNLLNNAVKYSHSGTVIELRGHREESRVVVEVEDEGQGIPADELESLFTPFGTTSVSATGGEQSTGLGLMIARRIIEGHGGEIWVASAEGQGSTFSFSLPLEENTESGEHAGEEERLPEDGTTGGEPDLPHLRILVAEDNRTIRTLVTGLLESRGHTVVGVGSGDAALEALAGGGFQMAILDLDMPGRGGIETVRQIRAGEAPGERLPVVALTGHRDDELSRLAREAGMDAWSEKPVELDGLMAALREAWRKRAG